MGTQLDFSGRTQLYYQVYDILHDDIRKGVYKPGELLPTENELIDRYKISRVTVRKAMDLLLNDGLIAKRRGYGTFVQPHKVEQTMSKVLHFSSDMEKRGFKSSTSMLVNEMVPATKAIAEALNIDEGEPMVHVSRLRYADGIPMCMESAYLIYKSCPDVLGKDFSVSSMRNFLVEKYNIVWKSASQKIFAMNATPKLAGSLQVHEGDPLFYIERLSFTQDGKPGEYLQSYYRGDSYYLTAELQG